MTKPKCAEELATSKMLQVEVNRHPGEDPGSQGSNPIITVSRCMGSGAHIVAQKLAADLGWKLWDREILDLIASGADVTRDVVETFDEKRRSEISLLVQTVLGNHEPAGFLYGKHIKRVVEEIAKLGSAVIVGRGANFVLPDALHIRIDASFEYRVANMMKFEGLSQSEAEDVIRKSDKERHSFLVSVYGKKEVERFRYELWLLMDSFSIDDASEILKTAASCRWPFLVSR